MIKTRIYLPPGKGPAALMLAPTRELAAQIAAVLEEAGAKVGLKTLCVYGGVPKGPQAQALRKGVEIVVATPGRLEDLLQDGACRCGRLPAPCDHVSQKSLQDPEAVGSSASLSVTAEEHAVVRWPTQAQLCVSCHCQELMAVQQPRALPPKVWPRAL